MSPIAVSILLGVLLGVSVLAHELGHCLAARLLGMPVFGVRLYLLGGVSELAPAAPVTARGGDHRRRRTGGVRGARRRCSGR